VVYDLTRALRENAFEAAKHVIHEELKRQQELASVRPTRIERPMNQQTSGSRLASPPRYR
jgi:hypothetical protein